MPESNGDALVDAPEGFEDEPQTDVVPPLVVPEPERVQKIEPPDSLVDISDADLAPEKSDLPIIAEIGFSKPPEKARALESASIDTGLDPATLASMDPRVVSGMAKAARFNSDKWEKENPALSKYIKENPDKFASMHDDLGNLSSVAEGADLYKLLDWSVAAVSSFRSFPFISPPLGGFFRGAVIAGSSQLVSGATGILAAFSDGNPEDHARYVTSRKLERLILSNQPDYVRRFSSDLSGPSKNMDAAFQGFLDNKKKLLDGQILDAYVGSQVDTARFLASAGPLMFAIAKNPAGATVEGVKSLVSSIPTIGAALVGTAALGPPGGASGMLTASSITETGAAITERLEELGVDTTNYDAVDRALGDKSIRDELQGFALRTGVTRGSVATILDLFGGKLLSGPVSRVVAGKASALHMAGTAAKTGFVGFTKENVTEFSGDVAGHRGLAGTSPGGAFLEGVLGAGSGAMEMLSSPSFRGTLPQDPVKAFVSLSKEAVAASEVVTAIKALKSASDAVGMSVAAKELPSVVGDLFDSAKTSSDRTATIYVGIEAWNKTITDAGLDPKTTSNEVNSDAGESYSLGDSKKTIAVNTRNFASRFFGTPVFDAILPSLQLTEGGPTFSASEGVLAGVQPTLIELAKESARKADEARANAPLVEPSLENTPPIAPFSEQTQPVGPGFVDFIKSFVGIKKDRVKITPVVESDVEGKYQPAGEDQETKISAKAQELIEAAEEKARTERAGRLDAEAKIKQLGAEARIDKLTGLRNGLAFSEDAKNKKKWRSTFAMDFDHFGVVNNFVGHDTMNSVVLPAVGRFFKKWQGTKDQVRIYRLHAAGDEFGGLFSGSKTQALSFVREMRKALENTSIEVILDVRGVQHRVLLDGNSFSFGIGDDYATADTESKIDKIERSASGEREYLPNKHRGSSRIKRVVGGTEESSGGGEGSVGETSGAARVEVQQNRRDQRTPDVGRIGSEHYSDIETDFIAALGGKTTNPNDFGRLFIKEIRGAVSYLTSANKNKLTPNEDAFINESEVLAKHLGADSVSNLEEKHYEKFADEIEAYTLRGEVPSKELAPVFTAFMGWFREMNERHGNKISMGEETKDALPRHRISQDVMEKISDDTGGTNSPGAFNLAFREEFDGDDVTKAQREATASAQAAIVARLIDEKKRLRTGAWAKKKDQYKKEALESLGKQPRYVAQEFLKAMKSEVPVGPGGDYVIPDADLAAIHLGYPSAAEMNADLDGVMDIDDAAEMIANQRLIEEGGDLAYDPDALYSEALYELGKEHEKELFNKQLSWMEKHRPKEFRESMKALGRKIDRKKYEDLVEKAREILAGMKYKDLSPTGYRVAAERAAKEKNSRFQIGDFVGSNDAIEQEASMNAFFREATKAVRASERSVAKLRAYTKTDARARLGKNDANSLGVIDGILEQYDLKKDITDSDVAEREARSAWYERKLSEGEHPYLPKKILNEMQKKPWTTLTVGDIADLSRSVESIAHVASVKGKLIREKKGRSFIDLISGVIDNINKQKPKPRTQFLGSIPLGEKVQRTLEWCLMQHLRLSSLVREIDGMTYGPLFDAVIRPGNEAGTREVELRREAAKTLDKAQKNLSTKGLGNIYRVPGTNIFASREDILGMALNGGTADSYQKLLVGMGISPEEYQKCIDELNADEWEYVQAVWKVHKDLRGYVESTAREFSGVPPTWLETRKIKTRYGEIQGEYLPLYYDGTRVVPGKGGTAEDAAKFRKVIDSDDADDLASIMGRFHRTIQTAHGERMERVPGVVAPVKLTVASIANGIDRTIHDVTHAVWVRDTNKIFNALEPKIIERYGDAFMRRLRWQVEYVASGDAKSRTGLEKIISFISTGQVGATLGYNLITAQMQTTGALNAVARVPASELLKSVAGALPRKKDLGRWSAVLGHLRKMDPKIVSSVGKALIGNWGDMVSAMLNASAFMRTRSESLTPEMRQLFNELRGGVTTLASIGKFSFTAIAVMQRYFADTFVWHSERAHQQEQASGRGEFLDEDTLTAMADQAVKDTQGGGTAIDTAPVQTGVFGKLAGLYMTWGLCQLSTGHELVVGRQIKKATAEVTFTDDLSTVGKSLIAFSLAATIAYIIKYAAKGDDDPFWVGLAKENLYTGVAPFAGVRDIGMSVMGMYPQYPAGFRGWMDVTDAASGWSKVMFDRGKVDEQLKRKTAMAVGIGLGGATPGAFPAVQLYRSYEGASNFVNDPDLFTFMEILNGPRQRKRAN
jgi:GGDEF domain-containing protein